MSDIVEAVKDGLRTALAKRPGWSRQGSYVVNNAVFTDISLRDLEALARAAIEAYEAEKTKQAAWAEKLGKDSIRRFQENNR